jgi:hypothetical protein
MALQAAARNSLTEWLTGKNSVALPVETATNSKYDCLANHLDLLKALYNIPRPPDEKKCTGCLLNDQFIQGRTGPCKQHDPEWKDVREGFRRQFQEEIRMSEWRETCDGEKEGDSDEAEAWKQFYNTAPIPILQVRATAFRNTV